MKVEDLKQALAAAEAHAMRLTRKLAKGGVELAEIVAAGSEVLRAERALAAAKGEPHAVPVDCPIEWDVGAPLPHLLQNDNRVFLIFHLLETPSSSFKAEGIGIVEFLGCICTRMGMPDEAIDGHPLNGRGLRPYAALKVENSTWIEELKRICAAHREHDHGAKRWKDLKHYFFGFHDASFECVAQSFKTEVRDASLDAVIKEVCGRL
jgi:hypothetical protein